MITRTVSIENMDQADEEKLSKALNDVWGVRKIKLNSRNGEAVISFDEDAASFMDFEQAIKDCGYNILSNDE
ncbi:heavy-metal-associated domain-containing protein [Cytobacillus firmus]|uniref:Heavy-metal-associated domain-containing protein n=2 Tax=Cytobacillus TaxID=2675230 RepID=A0A366K4H2_CYTFI|nr:MULTISPECIES: heavy metal-associated domain-containing protein [Cytobacillus]RBP96600.1 heavy-metal-associated domain-containing protein [Cytobacillus firmus]TDX45673.1 heavy-metal-associated domain-containing protein [Cytobacillus oceanisediminis]